MEGLFIEYKDPLFGIIVFFTLVFMITFFSYWWGKYRLSEDEKSLDKFIKSFHTLPTEEELGNIINSSSISHKSLLLLANTYMQNGDYEKGIEIYSSILEKQISGNDQKEVMILLGQAYLKAGFLERAKKLFLQILSRYPRTPIALQFLLVIYEKMHDFKKAMEVLEPLNELEMEIAKDSTYLKLVSLQYDDMEKEQKVKKLLSMYKKNSQLGYMIFQQLFHLDTSTAWKHLDQSLCERISDILWNLEPHQLDLDIIASNAYLQELYSAKGFVNMVDESSIFELDILINLQKSGYKEADLQFEYLCNECKQVFPFSFHRCPNCLSIDTLQSEMLLTRSSYDTHLSFA